MSSVFSNPLDSRNAAASESRLLKLPFEIRQLIYGHLYHKEYIIIPHPQPCRYREWARRPLQTVFYHPDPGNMHVYGINGAKLQWVVRHVPAIDFLAMRFDYDPLQWSSSPSDGEGRLNVEYAWPLGATCRQLHDEVRRFVWSARASFAFADFRSLIIWLKRTDPSLLALVRTIKLEMHLGIDEPEEEFGEDSDVTDEELAASIGPYAGVSEADEPWFDALKMARERLPNLNAFSMHTELCGPALAPSVTFGPSGRITGRQTRELKFTFKAAASRVIEAAKDLIPTTMETTTSTTAAAAAAAAAAAEPKTESIIHDPNPDPNPDPDTPKRKNRTVKARHLTIMAVQRHPPSMAKFVDYHCRGITTFLGRDVEERVNALEVLPAWQVGGLGTVGTVVDGGAFGT